MKKVGVLIRLPSPLKAKLDALRKKGYTVTGYIQSLLERELNEQPLPTKKGGQ